MTTELVLLLSIFALLTGPMFFSDRGPVKVFEKSGPRLGARLEKQLTTGRAFKVDNQNVLEWQKPAGAPPDGRLH